VVILIHILQPQAQAREGIGNLVLWESYNLRIPYPPASGAVPSFHSAPRLVHDSLTPDRVYIVHSAGVHLYESPFAFSSDLQFLTHGPRISLTWMKPLELFTLDTAKPVDTMADLPQGQLEHLLSSMPLMQKSVHCH